MPRMALLFPTISPIMENLKPENTAQKIKKLRLIRGYTQEYMAYKMRITQAGYSKIETSETSITLERAAIIAEIFAMSLVELIEWKEPNP